MRRLSCLVAGFALLVVVATGSFSRAVAQGCEAALVLAMDVSGSVDAAEYRLQVDGLAEALGDGAVIDALVEGRVALAVTQWSGVGQQSLALGWQRMETARDVGRFRESVRLMPRVFSGETAVGDALFHALDQLRAVPDCRRRIVDMSGDGAENAGYTINAARRAAIEAGVEVNGLAIEGLGLAITNFYQRFVITPGGFVETARGHLDYARAIRAKILRELTRPSS